MSIKFTDVSPALELPSWPEQSTSTLIEVTPIAYAQAMAHLTHQSVEQGGLLIGKVWKNQIECGAPQIACVQIREAIASLTNEATAFSLKMSADVWANANQRIATSGDTDLRIVGWFHSHPNLGAFLSATDKATQAGFFYHSYSVGWVIDPFAIGASQHQAFFLGPKSIELKLPI